MRAALRESDEELMDFLQELDGVRFVSAQFDELAALRVVEELRLRWPQVSQAAAQYWLGILDAPRRRRIFDVVRTKVASVAQRLWPRKRPLTLRSHELLGRILDRLLYNGGRGILNTMDLGTSAWGALEPLLALGSLTPTEQRKHKQGNEKRRRKGKGN